MSVRRYEDADHESVAALDVDTQVETFADVRLHAGAFSWQEMALSRPTIKHHDLAHHLTENAWDRALVATLDRRVCAFAAYAFSAWNRRLVLLHMYVDSKVRGQGVGSTLMDAMLNDPGANRAQHPWLETQTNNVPAIRAYEKMGFRIVGLDQTLYADRLAVDTALYMSRRIRD